VFSDRQLARMQEIPRAACDDFEVELAVLSVRVESNSAVG
jgi:hypothetical protein